MERIKKINYPNNRNAEQSTRVIPCEVCSKEFKITPTRLRKNKHHTCSKKCGGVLASRLRSRKIKTNCTNCGKEILYKQSHLKKIKYPACSRECTYQVKKEQYKGICNPNANAKMTELEALFYKRCLNLAYRASVQKIDFNLDVNYMIELYDRQKGLCYYSGFPLNLNKKGGRAKFDTLSVDKVIPSKGYTKGNVVLCLNCVNIFKNDHELSTIMEVFKSIIVKHSNGVILKVKPLFPDSQLPKRNSPSDAGIDMFVHRVEDFGHYIKVYTGVSVQPDVGYFCFLAPRSSSFKKGISLFNNLGVIDNSYTGEVIGIFLKEENYEEPKPGERVLQLIAQKQIFFEPVWADELSKTDRGDNGFGSTGV